MKQTTGTLSWAWILAIVIGLILAPATMARADEPKEKTRVFRAGASASNITPPLGEAIVGGWIPIPAAHIHDELFARCLVLDDGNTQLAIVLCDNVGIPREVFDLSKRWIHEELKLPPAQVLLAATHTHSATTARGKNTFAGLSPNKTLSPYQQFLARRIADGVRRAHNNLQPARIGFGRTAVPSQVFNRRWHVDNPSLLNNPFGGIDQVRMNPPRRHKNLTRPAGPTDPEIPFISIQQTGGQPIAVLANYSLHYVGGVRRGDVSADYFGIFSQRISELLKAEKLNPPFIGILSNGTSGDINNINFQGESKRYEPYEKMTEVAELVAQNVFKSYASVEYHDWLPLGAAITSLPLKVRKPTPDLLKLANELQQDESNKSRHHSREKIYAERWLALAQAPDVVEIPLQVLRLGEVGIAAIPFEVFVEIGLEIKDRSPFDRTFTIELANGSYGYLPTPRQHRLGGYETWLGTNRVETGASEKITKSVLEMFEQLHQTR